MAPAGRQRVVARARRLPTGFGTGFVLGVGFGGFVDGIVFHQLLQWHHFISSRPGNSPSTVAGLEANTLADGLFHVFSWTMALTGAVMLWRLARQGARPAGRVVLGGALAGWGLFDVFDGAVLHLLANLHNLREGPDEAAYDLAYILLGLALAVAGFALARRGTGDAADAPAGSPGARRAPGRA